MSPTASLTADFGISLKNKTIYDIAEKSTDIGGSGSRGYFTFGLTGSKAQDSGNKTVTFSIGVGKGSPAEGHINQTETQIQDPETILYKASESFRNDLYRMSGGQPIPGMYEN